MSAERLTLREMPPQAFWSEHESAGAPPLMPVAAGGFSGRPRCRIFPVGSLWFLQLEIPAGWMLSNGPFEAPRRKKFRTLAAAVNHAVLHGYDYRIVRPAPVARLSDRRRITTFERQTKGGAATEENNTEH